MPIFQDDLGGSRTTPPRKTTLDPRLYDNEMRRQASEESIRTELCEGPVPDSPELQAGSPLDLGSNFIFPAESPSNRIDLIQRLKRRGSPSWFPSRNLESLLQDFDRQTPIRQKSPGASKSSPLLPPAEFSQQLRPSTSESDRLQEGLEIERPRSALHSGDFTEARQQNTPGVIVEPERKSFISEPQSWLSTSPPRDFKPFPQPRYGSTDSFTPDPRSRYRAPSLSSSYSSSFILKPPTSPLVQSESNEDLELSSFMNPIDITQDARHNSRRHTLQTSQSVSSTPVSSIPVLNRALPSLRRDNIHPYQAHQPRRSLTLNAGSPYPSPSPQSPAFFRSRRQSITSEGSSLHHASMVGSYEESILRGRMSTTPSKPLDFVAQIGVLGLGKCKAGLKCPPHVTLPFPAVFYSYETTSHSRIGKLEDGPSPYVGQIDLENCLPNLDEARDCKRKKHTVADRNEAEDPDKMDLTSRNQKAEKDHRKAEKQKRRSTSPRAPPGGSYRIPEKGQLQIIIKNPNKTAVKLFLVPYDLAGMEPGTKTFIRQRSYSAGPIIDSAISSNLQKPTVSRSDRPTLRYLVHIHICCTARGRFFLYKSIRVVFANRVPDGKEKLQNEVTVPEPRFSVYKPGRESGIGIGAGANLAAEKAFRRRSSGFPLTQRNQDGIDGIRQALERSLGNDSTCAGGSSGNHPVEPIPFNLSRQRLNDEHGANYEQCESEFLSPTSSKSSRPATSHGPGLSMSWNSNSTGIGGYDKLNKGDVGYGGNAFSGSPDGKQGVAESLLAKKLKGLGVGHPNPHDGLHGV